MSSETPRHKWTGVLLGSPSIAFTDRGCKRFTARGHLRWPVHGPSFVLPWHLYCYHTGQRLSLTTYTPRVQAVVFVRVQWTQRVVHLARSLVNTFVFLPAALRRRTYKHDLVVKVLMRVYYFTREMST